MSFKDWVVDNFIDDDSPAGDFANDLNRDNDFPIINSYHTIKNHLLWSGADSQVMHTFKVMWERFRKDVVMD